MTTARRMWFGAALVAVALVLAGLSTLAFLRAGETGERLDGHRQKVSDLLAEAEAVKEKDQRRYDELTAEAERYLGFAGTDDEEHRSQFTSAALLGAGASASLAGCLILFLVRTRAPRPRRA
ncbi:hypothetical protein ABZ470_33870 [Streptosporangium sp. NPDC020072]|uniref:hypothetical protein n=1 Tax=Streptosporangium sp. NPDC020072 TaxID=3154788 RepID=UPI00342F4AA7